MTARVTASYHFADGDFVSADVEIPTGYPDQLDEAVKTCVRLFREAIVIGLESQADEDEGE